MSVLCTASKRDSCPNDGLSAAPPARSLDANRNEHLMENRVSMIEERLVGFGGQMNRMEQMLHTMATGGKWTQPIPSEEGTSSSSPTVERRPSPFMVPTILGGDDAPSYQHPPRVPGPFSPSELTA